MRTFRRFDRQRAIAKSLRMSAMGKRSQEVQRERRLAEMTPEVLREMESNPPLQEGSALGMLRYHDFCSGRVTSWVIERGDRTNNYRLRHPDGRRSKPHGLAWILEKVRPVLLGKKIMIYKTAKPTTLTPAP
jgi:hypothetical protein